MGSNPSRTVEGRIGCIFQAVEGETNPRNLHTIFGLWPFVMTHFDLAEYTEDVFELFSCYFPIDFNPSKVSGIIQIYCNGGV